MAAAALMFTAGCDDNTESLGLNLIADEDVVNSKGQTFSIDVVENFIVDEDSMYTNSTIAYLGRYKDDMFGDLECSFITQLYCQNNFTFDFDQILKDSIGYDETTGKTIYEFKDVSCYVSMSYESFFGDSVNPCQVEVYELIKGITSDMITSMDPEAEGFYDPENGLLGKVTYTAANTYIDVDERTDDRYLYVVVPSEIGQEIMNLNYQHPEYFTNATAFNEYVMNGLYLKPTSGDGTIIYGTTTALSINFTMYVDSSGVYPIKRQQEGYTDEDSIAIYSTSFNSTREVYQVNTFKNVMNDEILNDTENTYLKSPAGIFTMLELPVGKIANTMSNDTIIQTRLTLQAYNQREDNEVNMSKPEEVLLVRKSEVYSFFRNKSLPDSYTTFTTTLDTSTNTYVFENITSLIDDAISNGRDSVTGEVPEDLVEEVVIVPVTITTSDSEVVSVRNNLTPQYARIVKSGNKLEVSSITLGR